MIIALAGKGGTGKTTIAASLVRYAKEKEKGSVLAIDADPNSNLGEQLGITVKENMGQIIEDIAKNPSQIPAGTSKDRYIEYKIQSSVAEADGFDCLAMGLPEGPGCYCYANTVLRGVVTKLAGDYKTVIIDNEAGMEHLSRRTMRSADCLCVVSDYSKAGMQAARRIYFLTRDLKLSVGRYFLLINRVSGSCKHLLREVSECAFDSILELSDDRAVTALSVKGSSVFSLSAKSKFYKAITTAGEKIWG